MDAFLQPHFLAIRIQTVFSFVVAASWVSWGFEKGAEHLSTALSYGGDKLRDNMRPGSEEKPVSERARNNIAIARKATNKAVSVSSYLGMYDLSVCLAVRRTV